MATQARLPGTLPSPESARKSHAEAVKEERRVRKILKELRETMVEIKAELTAAEKKRVNAEDDLDAIDEGRRP
jgi:hypothetical protein